MDKAFLDKVRYNWSQDSRKLKINDSIPDGRCIICGRIFLNADKAISICKICDKAMSICRDGPDHDYDSWGNNVEMKNGGKIKLTARREVRSPIDFDKEHEYFDKNNKGPAESPHFVTAAGKILSTEYDSEYQERLYNLQGEDTKK